MNVLIVYAHPNPQSFNASVCQAVKEEVEKKGWQLKLKDLYAMNWNPVLSQSDYEAFHSGNIPADIMAEQADVSWADLVIMIAPVWWSSVPAILKGYIDRVFSIGFAYEYTPTGPRGKLGGKKALFITCSGADEQAAQANGMIAAIKRSLVDGFFGFCGIAEFKYKNLAAVTVVTDEERKKMLNDIREIVKSYS